MRTLYNINNQSHQYHVWNRNLSLILSHWSSCDWCSYKASASGRLCPVRPHWQHLLILTLSSLSISRIIRVGLERTFGLSNLSNVFGNYQTHGMSMCTTSEIYKTCLQIDKLTNLEDHGCFNAVARNIHL